MIALLGVLMVVSVSGCEQVEGVLGDSVLLPCSCSGRDTTKPVEWQMVEQFLVFKNKNNVSEFNKNYLGRASVFLESNSSLLLTQIRKEDQGEYKCICHIEETYKNFCVNLTVVAHFSICQSETVIISPESKNEKVFHCNLSGYDKEAKIQWYSGEHILTNSSETTITHTHTLDTGNGFNSFSSSLRTHLNISKPKCDVRSEDVQTSTTESCSGDLQTIVQTIQERHRYISIITFVMAAGLCVILCCWWKFS